MRLTYNIFLITFPHPVPKKQKKNLPTLGWGALNFLYHFIVFCNKKIIQHVFFLFTFFQTKNYIIFCL